jgi:uncharacterized RDD family membrane protein YckC
MYTETNVPEKEQHLFLEEDLIQYRDASLGQRFLNFLLDTITMSLSIGLVVSYVEGIVLWNYFPDLAVEVYSSKGLDYFLIAYISGSVSYLIYYTFCETVFKGYTMGKLITGTKAVRADGKSLRFKDALLRSLCRIIPFEPLSALGPEPWHDSMTKTIVIKSR